MGKAYDVLPKAGMEYIRMVLEQKDDDVVIRPKKKLIGSFGIKEANGFNNVIFWKVSPYRTDRRYGVVDRPAPVSAYAKSLWEGMFKKW